MNSDRAIESEKDDRLGFGELAEKLAEVINNKSARDGFVIGIEGKWGSGKSSLINLTRKTLEKLEDDRPEIIFFSPWLIGRKENLWDDLLGNIAKCAINIEPNIEPTADTNTSSDPQKLLAQKEMYRNNLKEKFDLFYKYSPALSKIVKGATNIIPGAGVAGAAIEEAGKFAKEIFTDSYETRKKDIVEVLKLASRKIVIFVDDLDRLEPAEAAEVLRLVKAVADFPNIIYVLSYDKEILAASISRANLADDGLAFLEKIIQVSFCVPQPEAFDLRRWLRKELQEEFGLASKFDTPTKIAERVEEVIDTFGGKFLKTPRDIIRILNALRLHAAPVLNDIDLADMIFLQFIRINQPALYRWVEEYVISYASVWEGGYVSEQACENEARSLEELLKSRENSVNLTRDDLSSILPGIKLDLFEREEKKKRRVYNNTGEVTFQNLIREKRLASPEHFRFYFALSRPSGAMDDREVGNFISLAEHNQRKANDKFAEWASKSRRQGGTMAEVLIERILIKTNEISPEAAYGIILGMGDNLDLLQKNSTRNLFIPHPWKRAEKALGKLLERISDSDQRFELLRNLFSKGKALGWLVSVLRGEIFAHGHYGQKPKPLDQRLLKVEEFQEILPIILRRFSETPAEKIMETPDLLSLLYCWQQGAKNEDAAEWVKRNTRSDEQLIRFLSRVRGVRHRDSFGLHYPLIKRELAPFIDCEESLRRVKEIAERENASVELKIPAKELLTAFAQGEAG